MHAGRHKAIPVGAVNTKINRYPCFVLRWLNTKYTTLNISAPPGSYQDNYISISMYLMLKELAVPVDQLYSSVIYLTVQLLHLCW